MKPTLNLSLAALLLLSLAPMPYGYNQLFRFVATIVFAIMAYQYVQKEPIFKIALGRTMWNVVDVVVAVGGTHSSPGF